MILRTDPAAGSLVEISRNGPQGTLFERPFDLALEADGDIVVADMGTPCTPSLPRCADDGRIIRVDSVTGRQTLVASGTPLVDPAGIAVAPDGSIYVADNLEADDDGAVIRVDPGTGAKTLLTEGGLLDLPFGILVDQDGSLVVSNRVSAAGGCALAPGRLVRVQLADGSQQLIAEGLGLFKYPLGVALDSQGRVSFANECGPNGLVRLNGGVGSLITANIDSDVLVTPERIALDPAGDFLVSDFSVADGDGGIVKVDAETGAQSMVRQGDLFNHPMGIAVVVNRPPVAVLRLPVAAAAGRAVRLDGSASTDPERLRLVYEWDLDGDGVFETGSGHRRRDHAQLGPRRTGDRAHASQRPARRPRRRRADARDRRQRSRPHRAPGQLQRDRDRAAWWQRRAGRRPTRTARRPRPASASASRSPPRCTLRSIWLAAVVVPARAGRASPGPGAAGAARACRGRACSTGPPAPAPTAF